MPSETYKASSTRSTRSSSKRASMSSQDPFPIVIKSEPDSISEGEDELEEDVEPPAKKVKVIKKPEPVTPKKNGPTVNSSWTPEKRAAFIEKVIEAGYRALDLNEVGDEVSSDTFKLLAHPSSASTSAS